MKSEELHQLTIEELDAELHKLKEELFSLRFKPKEQINNPLRFRTLRKEIARILTIKNEKLKKK